MCVCDSEREREGGRRETHSEERKTEEKDTERDRDRQNVSICTRVCGRAVVYANVGSSFRMPLSRQIVCLSVFTAPSFYLLLPPPSVVN